MPKPLSDHNGALSKAWAALAEYGPVETFYRLLHRFRVVSVQHSLNLFEKSIEQEKELNGELAPGMALKEIRREEIERYRWAEGLETVERSKQRFDEGSRLFAAVLDGQLIVSVNWVSGHMELCYVNRPKVALPEGTVYFHSALTAPAYRSHGVGSKVRNFMFVTMKNEGARRAILATFLENDGANRWHERNGFARLGRVTYLRLMGKEFLMCHLNAAGRPYEALLQKGEA
jgi:GNAT superfamily N-acetyltransferase